MKNIIKKIKDWHRGPFVEPPYDPYIFLMGHYDQPKLARFFDRLVEFWLAHWKFIIGTVLTIAALIIASGK